jgi:hypothetical protein
MAKIWKGSGWATLELLDYLCPRLKDFVTHNFIAKWQNKLLNSLPFPF